MTILYWCKIYDLAVEMFETTEELNYERKMISINICGMAIRVICFTKYKSQINFNCLNLLALCDIESIAKGPLYIWHTLY